MKPYKTIALIAILLVVNSCTTTEHEVEPITACGCSDPLNQLPWLKSKVEIISKDFGGVQNPDTPNLMGVVLYSYNEREVIEVQSSLMSSHNLSQYYCDGTKLEFSTTETTKDYKNFLAKKIKLKVLFGTDFWQR